MKQFTIFNRLAAIFKCSSMKNSACGAINKNRYYLFSIILLLTLGTGNAWGAEATLSFADKAQRTSYSTSQQVWEQNGITFTNDKASSTTNVADYAKPARLYASSSVTIECSSGNITQIVFDCNSSSYATALKNSIGSSATASSDKVTIVLDGSTTTFTIAKLTAQVRLDALTVTYEEGCSTPNITTQPIGATYAKDATAAALEVVASGDALTYQWYSNTSNSINGAAKINSATNSTYTPTTTTVGTKYYYCVVSSGSCSTTSNIVSVVVNQTYTVTYDANGATSGSAPTDATKYSSGASVTVKANSDNLAKTGYTFAGWNTKADGTGTTYTAGTGTFTISANTTLYAKWTANTYTVKWIVDGKTARTDTGVAYNTSKTAPAVSPIPCGDVIAGWTDAENYVHGTSTLYSGATPLIQITGNKTFYAVFADYAN